ncbi:MAG: hypothetical protein HN790_04115 [Methylococcales bacterium]|nr:hypothetical protein [Methylococcales bacterium]
MWEILKQASNRSIFVFALLLSGLMSLYLIMGDDTINTDGIVHLGAARMIAEGDWAGAVLAMGWPPVYQASIAYIHLWTGLSLENAAHAFSLVTYLVLVVAFLACLSELTENKRILWLGVLVIFINADINGTRADVYKDSAYWAGYLSALWFMLRYVKTQQWTAVLGWYCAIVFASFYRFEGMAFVLMLPLVLFWLPGVEFGERVKLVLKIYTPILLVVVSVLLLLSIGRISIEQIGRFSYPIEIINALFDKNSLFGQTVVKVRGMVGVAHYSAYVLVIIMITFMVLLKLFKSLGLAFTLLSLLWVRHRRGIPSAQQLVIFAAISVNMVVLMMYSVGYFFLQARYTSALALTIMLVIPFALDDLLQRWQTQRTRWVKATVFFVGIWFVYMSVDSLTTMGATKHYIREAGQWIGTIKTGDQSMYVDDEVILYYSGAKMHAHATLWWPDTKQGLEDGVVQKNDIIALRVRKKRAERLPVIKQYLGEPDRVFENENADQVLVYIKK